MPWLISRVGLLLAPLAFLPWSVPKEEVPPRINELFESRQVVFGFTEERRAFCDLMGDNPDYSLVYLLPQHMLEHGFAPLPIDSFPKSSTRCLGDTLTTLWPGGGGRMIIDSIGYYSSVCHSQFAYLLRPIDTLRAPSAGFETTLFLQEEVKLSGSIIPYIKFEVWDSSLRIFEDSMRAVMLEKAALMPEHRRRAFRAEYYGVQSANLPDTLFMTIHGAGTSEWCWHAVYLLARTARGWTESPIIELQPGLHKFRIDCSFDIDGDNLREFLVILSPGAAIYQLRGKRLIQLLTGGPGGC